MQFGFGTRINVVTCVFGFKCIGSGDVDASDGGPLVLGRKDIGLAVIGQHNVEGVA